jgi:hypothetical protein
LAGLSQELLFPRMEAGHFQTSDAQAVPIENGLRIITGHRETYPGVTMPAPGGHWDLAAFGQVALRVKNCGSNSVTVSCRVDNPGADGTTHCVTGSMNLAAGQAGELSVGLTRTSDDTLGGKLFGMRGYPATAGGSNTIDPTNITGLIIFTAKPSAEHTFEITDLRAMGRYTPPTAWTSDARPFFPFIDTFGQYRHKDWPGKTASEADMAVKRQAEAADLAAQPGPADWDQYGGSQNGPSLPATGFFRTEKVKGKWWLVDPEGHLFFSQGIDCVTYHEQTPTEGRESWFDDFPGTRPEMKDFISRGHSIKGHYQGQSPVCFSFADANLLRKYGPAWQKVYPELVRKRLRSWGLNTIGNWSDRSLCAQHLAPYTDAVSSGGARMIAGSEGYWGKFPDVFDPSFTNALRRSMQHAVGFSAGDAWCLGYFSDNEMSWGDETSLALAALHSGPTQAAKQVFVSDLLGKYGEIARLNRAWGTSYASWDELRQIPSAPDKEKAREDLTAFYTKTAEHYFRTVREVIKAVAPHQLYLGCRFAWVNPLAAAAAAKYCDVVSYNIYHRGVADFSFNGGADIPLLIGEFHLGALDRGLFHPGLVALCDQSERAQVYQEYVEGALRHPQFVGCHWFQYRDEPVTGRVYDEENYQIGFVDVADTPYAETIKASRAVGSRLYR